MNFISILVVKIVFVVVFIKARNLSCYLCMRNSNEECGPEYLLPCPSVADTCVTHISKYVDKGYLIKRECGLGPCDFEDDMVSRGLGMDECDQTQDEYFCVFCCTTDGCNKNDSSKSTPTFVFPSLLAFVSFFWY